MDRYCPECNSTMTPSLVGYLCPSCGNLQRFYTQSSTITPRIESNSPNMDQPTIEAPVITNTDNPNGSSQNRVRAMMRRMMVPELAPPHHEQLISDEDNELQAQKADRIPSGTYDTNQSPLEPYQPDQIAQDFDAAKTAPIIKHSSKWPWILAVLFVAALVGLGLVYYFIYS